MTRFQHVRGRLLRPASFGLAIVLASVQLAAVVAPANGKTLTMKIGTPTINDAQHEWMKRFKARVEKRSDGKISVKLFPASALGQIPQMIQGLQLGTIEGVVAPSAFFVGVDPLNSVLGVPGLFKDIDHCWRTVDDDEFRALTFSRMKDKGIIAISTMCTSPVAFLTKRKIARLNDLKGLRVRVLASPLEIEPMKAIGVKPVPMPLAEVVPALKQNLIDGVSSIPVLFGKLKMDSIAKHITATNMVYIDVPSFVSTKFWDQLSADQQKMMLEEARAVEKEIIPWNNKANAAILAGWDKRGGTVSTLPMADQEKLLATAKSAAVKYIKSKPVLNAHFQKINAIVTRNR